jgi:SNF2 family DNA or RNA helicase
MQSTPAVERLLYRSNQQYINASELPLTFHQQPKPVSDSNHAASKRPTASRSNGNVRNKVNEQSEDENNYMGDYKPCFSAAYTQADRPIALGGGIKINRYISRHLLDHQVEGVKWLHSKFISKQGGILGDDMGMGKTVQLTALLATLYGKTGASTDRSLSRMRRRGILDTSLLNSLDIQVKQAREYMEKLPSLVVVPRTLVENWKQELHRWGYFLVDLLEPDYSLDQIATADVVLVAYSQLNRYHDTLSKQHWEVIVCDEAHRLKNTHSQSYVHLSAIGQHCRALYLLTGTPIQNDLRELWSLLQLLYRGQFMERRTYIQQIEKPIKLGMRSSANNAALARGQEAQHQLDNILQQIFLRREKTLLSRSKEDSVSHEYGLKGKEEIIVMCDLSPLQSALYEHCLSLPDFDNVRRHREVCRCGSGKPRSRCCIQFQVPYVCINQNVPSSSSNVFDSKNIDKRAVIWRQHHNGELPCPNVMKRVDGNTTSNLIDAVDPAPPQISNDYGDIHQPIITDNVDTEIADAIVNNIDLISTTTTATTTPNAAKGKKDKKTNDRGAGCPVCILLPCLDKLLKIASHPALLQVDVHNHDSTQIHAKQFLEEAIPPALLESVGGVYKDRSIHNVYNLLSQSGKLQTLQSMLQVFVNSQQKVLVFSISVEVLSIIELVCKAYGYAYLRMDGTTSTKHRQTLIDEYNSSSSILVFLLSAQCGGLGVNLTSASKVNHSVYG